MVRARVKGFSETQVILREGLKNAALPTLTLVGVQFTFLIGGTVIVERLFSYEGLGNMAIDAVVNRDLPLIQGIVLGIALTVGAAFLHDNIVPPDPAAPLLEKQQIVNWDVLGRLVDQQVAFARRLWDQAFGR